jgi:hypothetical protein
MIFCTVADDRYYRKKGLYSETQLEIYNFINTSNIKISHFNMWGWDEIKNSKNYSKHKHMLKIEDPALNGRLYKPLLIRDSLDKISTGDYIIYNDVSPEMWNWNNLHSQKMDSYDINVIFELCDKNDNLLTNLGWFDHNGVNHLHFKKGDGGQHTHHNFTSEACIEAMNAEKYRYSLQHSSALLVIKKQSDTIDFVDEWIKFNSMPECGGLGKKENNTWFAEDKMYKLGHRHDQSISGILVNKKNGKLCEPELNGVLNPHNFLAYCQKNKEYTFIDSNLKKKSNKFFKRIPDPPYGFIVEEA